MKDFDNIEDWYRDELNNYNVEPDANGWDAIAENLDNTTPLTDNNISDWYKKEVAKLEERPDFTVWEKLSTKLDTTTVWDKLAVSLDRYELFLWWRNTTLKAAAVLLLLLGSYFTFQNFNSNSIAAISKKTNSAKSSQYGFASLLSFKDYNSATFSERLIKTQNNLTPKAFSSKRKSAAIQNANKTAKKTILNTKNTKESTPILASTNSLNQYSSLSIKNLESLKTNSKRNLNTNLNYNLITEKDISAHQTSKEFLVKKDKNKIVFNKRRFTSRTNNGINKKRLYIGANVGFKKQGLFTSFAQNTPLKDYRKKSLLDFGTNFGAILGLIVSDNLSIESNLIFNSTSGHKTAYSYEGNSFDEQLKINYTSASIIAKKTNNRSTFDSRLYSTNFFGGAYISNLRTEKTIINGTDINNNQFNNIDYGLILGIEQDRYITNNIVITPGIRYNQGVANIANKNSAFSSARNFSVEFNVGVKYIFAK